MLTKWGKEIVGCARASGAIPYVTLSSNNPAFVKATAIGGTSKYMLPAPSANATYNLITSAMVESGSGSTVGVAFGSDGTTPTENDYTLGGLITGLSATTPSIETYFDQTNYKYVARLDYTVSNNTGADVIIREVGLFVRFYTADTRGANASSTAAGRYSFMIDRTVLDSPVTIPSGTAGTIRYDFAY